MSEAETFLPPHGRAPAANFDPLLPCRWCETLTPRETLAAHGARCFGCYQRFLRQRQTRPAIEGDKRAGLRDWARALRDRQAAGEQLTNAQQDAWQAALRHSPEEASDGL